MANSQTMRPDTNIILIGMPGAGKSTVGVLLAKALAYDFIDTDLLIQNQQHCPLQSIVDEQGYQVLRDIEESVLMQIDAQRSVISTGGSAVYGSKGMSHLKQHGTCLYLAVNSTVIQQRIHNFSTRGLAKPDNQSFDELYAERTKLYEQYADLTIDTSALSIEETLDQVVELVK